MPGVMLALVPSVRAELQSFVVAFLVLFDEAFQADITADLQSRLIALQQEEQPRHPPIAVAEWVNGDCVQVRHRPTHDHVGIGAVIEAY